jgi:hypothetical protein
MRQNCWEIMNCGRQPGGPRSAELGVCPASSEARCDGVNSGKNAGRACWAVAGTLCGESCSALLSGEISDCLTCPFYRRVRREEGPEFANLSRIIAHLL